MFPLAFAGTFVAAGCDGSGKISTDAREGFGRNEATASTAPPVANASSADTGWAGTCPIPSDTPQAPLGQTGAALVSRYGPPASDERFVLGEALDPVRRSVRNVLSAPEYLRRTIREMTWRDRGCTLTIWLVERDGRERAVHAMRAPDGGES
ncbi:hypothetical protein [Sphingomonas hankookensis]|uniref:hypothetical protein n=1 Tax=Sphingomonas hankookensis TaxID=563996 RepID=UPI00234E7E1C|nr:hypothetical protein [Sphingomonas hankookensis]WCP73917.1 hypothetical protein PPZ50_18315 [Sphingomonas hankookensis]